MWDCYVYYSLDWAVTYQKKLNPDLLDHKNGLHVIVRLHWRERERGMEERGREIEMERQRKKGYSQRLKGESS